MSPRTAFDADVLIYAAAPGHPLGPRIAALFQADSASAATTGPGVRRREEWNGIGSVLLLTEVLAKPLRDKHRADEVATLVSLLSRLELYPVDEPTTRLALALAVAYGLRAADASHLATAVAAGADRFLTNNRKDFPKTITEIDIVYPDELPPAPS